MRKIVRRLLQYAYVNGIEEPFLEELVPFVIENMSRLETNRMRMKDEE